MGNINKELRRRTKKFTCYLRLKNLVVKITEPAQVAIECIRRYGTLRKIGKTDRWERHVKSREFIRKDELASRRKQFYLLKIQLIAAFFRTSICAGLQEKPNEVEESRKEFQKNKEELVGLLEKICNYEIEFNETIKSEITSWEFGKFENQEEELISWAKSVTEYVTTLDIKN